MMSQDYLRFIEEHSDPENANLFEKVLMTSKRAKALYTLDEAAKAALNHKPTFQAIGEANQGSIKILRKTAGDSVS